MVPRSWWWLLKDTKDAFPGGQGQRYSLKWLPEPAVALSSPCLFWFSQWMLSDVLVQPLGSCWAQWDCCCRVRIYLIYHLFTLFITAILHGDERWSLTSSAWSPGCCPGGLWVTARHLCPWVIIPKWVVVYVLVLMMMALLHLSHLSLTLTVSFTLKSLARAGFSTEITCCSSHCLDPCDCLGAWCWKEGCFAFIAAAVICL